MLKKFIFILMISIFMIGVCGIALAADTTYTATSEINGVTVNWSYELNSSNQIEELICTNPTELNGNLTLPSTLDGKTIISLGDNAFKSATAITSVEIPSSIKEIGLWAFSGCTSLSTVDLGSVEKLSDRSFEDCTALTSIKIPKTLTIDASGAPFLGCTNLTKIELEEGMTVIPNYLCAKTPITEITIPSSVKEIGLWAFSGCTSLSTVDLGSVEKLSDRSFEDCTALTSIKIPKTLTIDASGAPFLGCTNLTKIELEEGMTVIPNYLCAETPITEITIPNSVTEIGMWAFKSCDSLEKITILDNVTKMEGYESSNQDLVFQDHNPDLTIYCYRDSMAAQYAIKYNIKYEYLSKPADEGQTGENNDEENNTYNNNNSRNEITSNANRNTTNKDNTVATGKLPYAGTGSKIIGIIIVSIIILAVVSYKRYNMYKGI